MARLNSERVLDACGISYRRLDYWVRQGYLRPRDRRKESSGVPRDFTDDELAVAARMARLVNRGFTPLAAARIARVTPGTVNLGKGIRLAVDDTSDDQENRETV